MTAMTRGCPPLLLLLVLLLLPLVLSAGSPDAGCSDVKAPVGTIVGYVDSTYTSACHYTNIPYAHPPLGARRFSPPILLPSLPSNPFPATDRTLTQCIQTSITGSGRMDGLEDCLTLSITTPLTPSPTPLPVLVYLCGGGFQQCYPEDATRWVNRTSAFIFVSVTYRLGVLGFLSLRELSDEVGEGKVRGTSYSGNQGLQDQRTALHWLQQNIEAFGGDRTRVTIQGESAGSFSVCYQLLLANGSAVFSGAIAESGACEGPHPSGSVTLDQQEVDHHRYFVQPSPCAALKGPDLLTCLRNLSTAEVYELYTIASQSNPAYLPGLSLFVPVIDGVIVADTPYALFTSGRATAVPLIIGTNSAETIMCRVSRLPFPIAALPP